MVPAKKNQPDLLEVLRMQLPYQLIPEFRHRDPAFFLIQLKIR
jgi:hypothetical protein